jgi:hypothetical protein
MLIIYLIVKFLQERNHHWTWLHTGGVPSFDNTDFYDNFCNTLIEF